MQFLARLEAYSFAWGYAHFGSGAWIAADTGFAGANTEYAKSAQFDALACGQGLLQALENRIHRSLSLGARQARALDYMMDDVLFNQRGNLAGATSLECTTPSLLMLQVLRQLGNNRAEDFRFFSAENPDRTLAIGFRPVLLVFFRQVFVIWPGCFVISILPQPLITFEP
jgi:hypothetical protein